MAFDRFGRKIHYLRISLTDHCNLRCLYCLPRDATFRANAELMQDEEILRLSRLFAGLGFDKIRLTGGEPTLRPHLVDLVRAISGTPGIRSISMTTNGTLLSELAAPLASAGLQRVNISLDTLDPARFKQLTCLGNVESVWQGILAAERAGLVPLKLNVVLLHRYNLPDAVDLARLTLSHPWQVRYIEMMPFAGTAGFPGEGMVTAGQVHTLIEQSLGPLLPVSQDSLDGKARLFRLPGAQSTIGFIYSLSEPFCETCNRARLTADGILRMCLLRDDEVDLLTPMRQGASQADLRKLVLEAIWNKPWGQGLSEATLPLQRTLNQIGG